MPVPLGEPYRAQIPSAEQAPITSSSGFARPADSSQREWIEEFEAAARRTLETRFRYAFIHTYKPVLDDAPYRAFDSTEAYRDWCETHLPSWLGDGRV